MNKYILKIITGLAALFVVLTLADAGFAQRRARGRNYTKAQVDRLIKNVEERTDRFVSQFDRSLDRSRLNGTNREDNLNQRAKDLEAATDELRSEFDRRDRWIDNKEEVRKCLNIAADINVVMQRRRLGGGAENNWANVRRELNTLAQVYNLPQIGSGAYR